MSNIIDKNAANKSNSYVLHKIHSVCKKGTLDDLVQFVEYYDKNGLVVKCHEISTAIIYSIDDLEKLSIIIKKWKLTTWNRLFICSQSLEHLQLMANVSKDDLPYLNTFLDYYSGWSPQGVLREYYDTFGLSVLTRRYQESDRSYNILWLLISNPNITICDIIKCMRYFSDLDIFVDLCSNLYSGHDILTIWSCDLREISREFYQDRKKKITKYLEISKVLPIIKEKSNAVEKVKEMIE